MEDSITTLIRLGIYLVIGFVYSAAAFAFKKDENLSDGDHVGLLLVCTFCWPAVTLWGIGLGIGRFIKHMIWICSK